MNASVGISVGGNNTSLSGGNASIGSNNSQNSEKQTILTSLTGENITITVGENTNLKGSLIAAGSTDENGVFHDNHNLNLSTKTLTFENTTNTQSSNSQGLGMGAGVNPQGDISSLSAQLSTGTTYERTKTLATLGTGTITITDKENSDDLARLNTDTTHIDTSLFKTNTGTSASGTLDTRLLTEEGRAKIAEDATKTKEHTQDIVNGIITVATNGQINITNLIDTVQDNTSATKLKEYLTQTQEGKQILVGLQANPQSQEYHDAQIAANQKLQEFRGLEVEKVVYYDAKATTNEALQDKITYDPKTDTLIQKDTQGATITKGDSTGTILLDASGNAQNLSTKLTDTIVSGHEVGELKYFQNGYGLFFTDNHDTKEAMNDIYGAYYAQRLNEATNGSISDLSYATNTNLPFLITGTTSVNNMIIPDNGVEFRQLSTEEKGFLQKPAVINGFAKKMDMPKEKAKKLLELVAKTIVHGQEGFDSLDLLANYSFDDIKQAKTYLLETSKNLSQYNNVFDKQEGLFRPTSLDMLLPYDPSRSLESQGLERVVDAALALGVLKVASIAGKQVIKIGEKYFAKLDDGSVVEVPKSVVRQDNNFKDIYNDKGQKKSYIDANGNLLPANLDGKATVQIHIRGKQKDDSPYTSTSDLTGNTEPKKFGDEIILIDTKQLQKDINKGKVKDVEIIS